MPPIPRVTLVPPKGFSSPKPQVMLVPPPGFAPSTTKRPRYSTPNTPDVGDTYLRAYSPLETAVQRAELGDAIVSNAATGARVASAFTSSTSRISPLLRGVRTFGARMAPVQAALVGVDAARGVVDQEYRDETYQSFDRLADSDRSVLLKSLIAASNTLARPVSFPGAMLRSVQDSRRRIADADRAAPALDAALEQARAEAEARRRFYATREMVANLGR